MSFRQKTLDDARQRVIDNAIVGYGRVVLNLADEQVDDEG
jgi:hypothetical protein